MAVDFAIIGSLVRPGRPRYPVLVHRAAALLHASFRPHLAMTPLRFANPSPPSGWIEDFHLRAVVHARHTEKKPSRFRREGAFSATFSKASSRKVVAGFRKRSRSNNKLGRDDDSKKSHPALARADSRAPALMVGLARLLPIGRRADRNPH